MELPLIDLKNLIFNDDKRYIIFGAGHAGRQVGWYLENIAKMDSFCYCDNDIQKQNRNGQFPVYSVHEVCRMEHPFFLIAFLKNNKGRISSAIQCLKHENIKESQIVVIDMHKDYIGEIYIHHCQDYIGSLLKRKKAKENLDKINTICFLGAHRKKTEGRVSGGPSGAFYMQKEMLGLLYKSTKIRYPYFIENNEYNLPYNRYPGITGNISMTIDLVEYDRNTVYIANDLFSAFGLYIMGKNYCVLHHGQGDIVKELMLWGNNLTDKEKEMIYSIERISVENAYKVLFPSAGAEYFFRNSFKEKLSFNTSPPLYNTIIDFPEPKPIEGIEKKDSVITFLSIGQMTRLKGIDRIPCFLEKIVTSGICPKKIRWIVVADGILKDEIFSLVKTINQKYNCIEYINIDYKISHAQIFYLFNICDIYLMLHRVSICDFATLEAMYNKKAVILSNIVGNDEFNKEDNILLVDEKLSLEKLQEYLKKKDEYGRLNREVYDKYFSKKSFLNRHYQLFDEIIKNSEDQISH